MDLYIDIYVAVFFGIYPITIKTKQWQIHVTVYIPDLVWANNYKYGMYFYFTFSLNTKCINYANLSTITFLKFTR